MSLLNKVKSFKDKCVKEGEEIKKKRAEYDELLKKQSGKDLVKVVGKNCIPESKKGILISVVTSSAGGAACVLLGTNVIAASAVGLVCGLVVNQVVNDEGEVRELSRRLVSRKKKVSKEVVVNSNVSE